MVNKYRKKTLYTTILKGLWLNYIEYCSARILLRITVLKDLCFVHEAITNVFYIYPHKFERIIIQATSPNQLDFCRRHYTKNVPCQSLIIVIKSKHRILNSM